MFKIRNFKEIPYDELEALNLEAKEDIIRRVSDDQLKEKYIRYLHDERQLKAVTVCFSDLEGRFHMLDYDKKFLLNSSDNLSFDGSSIRGFSKQGNSDLFLRIDWGSFRWLPSDIFGPGKVMVFGLVEDSERVGYQEDLRGVLKRYLEALYEQSSLESRVAFEVEGFLFKGQDAEQKYDSAVGFEYVSDGGYFHTLPNTPLKVFIDHFAEAQRALGFENEKDHPEVAPSQFELNYCCTDGLLACDLVLLYKLLARQIASMMGFTASFLPKPVVGVNGSGMHANLSLFKLGENRFYDPVEALSPFGFGVLDRLLEYGSDLCLVMNSSVNSYRRLDPRFEAPNRICASRSDRSSMIRLPAGSEKSTRIEVRSVAPDSNPYMVVYSLLRCGLEGELKGEGVCRDGHALLADNLYGAIECFEGSEMMKKVFGEGVVNKYVSLKREVAGRSPACLGNRLKRSEIIFHHEVTNQSLWSDF